MDYQLFVIRGRSSSKAIRLAEGITSVGRHDDCQLRIKSSQVSRKHCDLFEKKGMLLVKDLGSSNGTFVNGKRVKEQRVLVPGDEITIGQVTLRVAKVGAEPPVLDDKPVGKPSDTAIATPAASDTSEQANPELEQPFAPAGDLDEFEIEFDEPPQSPAAAAPAAKAKPAAEAKTVPAPPPPAAPETPADDAVADFLFDIKLDDDE